MFKDRNDAALQLAEMLNKYENTASIVLAVPRGGVPIGYVIAEKLGLPLEVMLSKKIGHPSSKEYAIGAVSLSSVILNPDIPVREEYIDSEVERIRSELKRKYQLYIGEHKPADIKGKNVIIVDDGIATGSTVLAIIQLVKAEMPRKIIIAVPVAPPDTVELLSRKVDEVVCVLAPHHFMGVGQFYENFEQVDDATVVEMLKKAHQRQQGSA